MSTVGRPGRIDLVEVFGEQLLSAAALSRDKEDLPRLARLTGNESDLFSVRRPMREPRMLWRIRELHPFASVNAAAPKQIVWISNVGDPLTVTAEFHVTGGDAAQERDEHFRPGVVTH